MSKRYILNERDEPEACEELLTWARWFEVSGSRIVARDLVGDVRVSTVFLGLDHLFTEGSAPMLLETMIFDGPHDGYQERYASKADALEGHRKALAIVTSDSEQGERLTP